MSRESIRAASIELFSSKGYEGTSIKDIAQELSLTPPALYAHYKSKEDLYLDTLSFCLGKLSYGVKNAILTAKSQSTHDVLYNICSFYLEFYKSNKQETLFVLRSMMFPPADILEKSIQLTDRYSKDTKETTKTIFIKALCENEVVDFSAEEHIYYFSKLLNAFAFEVTALNMKITQEVFEKSWTRYWNSVSAQ